MFSIAFLMVVKIVPLLHTFFVTSIYPSSFDWAYEKRYVRRRNPGCVRTVH